MGKYGDALASANYVLNYFDPDNFKALMRKAEALNKMGKSDMALQELEYLQDVMGEKNPAVEQLIEECKKSRE